MLKPSYMDLNFKLYFEPDEGINTPNEFTEELLAWANREHRDLVILEESMEPKITLDGTCYVCKLGAPQVASQNNVIWKALGFRGVNPSIGRTLGYKWVYLYEDEM